MSLHAGNLPDPQLSKLACLTRSLGVPIYREGTSSFRATMHAFPYRLFALLVVCISALPAVTADAIAQNERSATKTAPGLAAVATRPAPRRAIVEGVVEPVQNLRITDLQGRDISAQVGARTENGKLTMDLAQSSAVVLKSKSIETIQAPRNGRIVLPGGAVVPLTGAPTGPTDMANKAIWFRLTLGASPTPAPWDAEADSYVTHLTFGLKRPEGAPPTASLDQPVIIKLAYKGLLAPETAMISLDQPGLENEKTIPLHFTPQSEKPLVLVRSSISEFDLLLEALPRLALFPERDAFLGLGLDVAMVTLTAVQPDGRSAPVDRLTPVNVTIEGGARLKPSAVSIPAGEASTRFAVRSSGLGSITIRANVEGMSGAVDLRQTFPTGPLVAALLGGALGGFARRFMKGARRASNQRRVVEGIVVASIVFVAGILGVGYLNLPSAVVATEAGAFLTGALSGFAGVTVLEQIGKRNKAKET